MFVRSFCTTLSLSNAKMLLLNSRNLYLSMQLSFINYFAKQFELITDWPSIPSSPQLAPISKTCRRIYLCEMHLEMAAKSFNLMWATIYEKHLILRPFFHSSHNLVEDDESGSANAVSAKKKNVFRVVERMK